MSSAVTNSNRKMCVLQNFMPTTAVVSNTEKLVLNIFPRTLSTLATMHTQSEVLILLSKSKYNHNFTNKRLTITLIITERLIKTLNTKK